MKRPGWLVSGLSILIVAITFLLPLMITRPELSFPAEPPPADWNIRTGYYNNIKEAASLIMAWMRLYGRFPIAILFLFVGLMSLFPLEQHTRIVIMAVLLGGLLCASLLQVLPRYPAEAFSRIWIPSVIFLTGLIAHGIWRWATAVIYWSRQLLQNGLQNFVDKRWILSRTGWAYVFLLLFGLVIARNSANHVINGQRIFREVLTITTDSQNSRLDIGQPLILQKAGCEDVLYMFEVPMHLYLTHGALACGAIYHPALTNTPEEAQWIQDNQNVGYVVTWNPTIKAGVTIGGNPLSLEKGDHLEFQVPEGWTSQHVYIYLENPGGATRLSISRLSVADGEKPKVVDQINIPAKWSGWQAIDIAGEELANGFRLSMGRISSMIFLRGIKSDPDSSLNWPWDQGLTLIPQLSKLNAPATEINFNTTNLVPYSNWSLTVVDDQGDTVLLKVNR
jgi:hypothetical protein